MKKVIAYKCDHCDKWLRTRSGMARHEKKCFWNPSNKACASCGYNSEYQDEHEHAEYDSFAREMYVQTTLSKSRWCDKLNFDIYKEANKLRKDCPFWIRSVSDD